MFSHKELQGLSCNDLQDKMFTEKGVNWNNLSTYQKRGSCVYKSDEGWVVDDNIPIFTEDRNYINSKINFE
jgi:tRNA(His) 5'-end guanylyltransferase